MPPHLKYATDSARSKKEGLHYIDLRNANYAWRPRERRFATDFAPKIARILLKLRNLG